VAHAVTYGFKPLIYASEALGLALAFGNEAGKAFANNFGPSNSSMPNSAAGDAAFASAAAIAIFGAASTSNLVKAIQDYVFNWKSFFSSNGIPGNSKPSVDQVDLAARGAAWGDAVGLALDNKLGTLYAQTVDFLKDAAQGTAIYSAPLSSQPKPGLFQGETLSALSSDLTVGLTGVTLEAMVM
jgi:hypothetical protein